MLLRSVHILRTHWSTVGTASSCESGHDGVASLAASATAVSDACTASSAKGRGTQAAGVGASAVVDTRLLGKPVAFDGRETSWRSFKFQLVACCGAIDSRLKDLLVLGGTRDVAAMRHIHMDPDNARLSMRSSTTC